MVLSGLTFLRVSLRAVLVFLSVASIHSARAQEFNDLTGTMPEDHFPALKELLQSALRRSPEMIEADFEILVREAGITIADSARLPNLRGASEYASNQTSASGNNSSQSRASGFFYRFEAGQAIFHWNALKNQSLAARASLQGARVGHAITFRAVSVVIRKAYLALVVEKARLRQGRKALEILTTDLSVLEQRRQAGVVSSGELAGAQLRADEVRTELQRGESEFAANRQRLARIAGLKEMPEENIADEIPDLAHSDARVEGMTAQLLRNEAKSTLEYELYARRVELADYRYRIEKVRLLPKINLGAGYSLENNTDVNGATVNQQAYRRQAVNIGAQWNMFDGLATRGAIREALAVKRQQQRQLEVRTEAMIQDAQILARTLTVDAKQAELTKIRRDMAEASQRRIRQEVELGQQRRSQIERANIDILAATARNFETRALYLSHWCDFVALAGEDPVLRLLSDRHASAKK